VTEYRIPNLSVLNMAVVKGRSALLVLSSGAHKLYCINLEKENVFLEISTVFANITDECLISNMFVQELSQEFREEQFAEYKFFEDCIIFFGLDNGNMLSTLLKFDGDPPFTHAALLPQNLFVLKDRKSGSMTLMTGMTFDPTLDLVYYSDQHSLVRNVRKSLSNIVQANSYGFKAVEYEDPKSLPIFSFKPYKKKGTA